MDNRPGPHLSRFAAQTSHLLTRALPPGHQARYLEEWRAEIADLEPWPQVRHLASIACGLLALRRALAAPLRPRRLRLRLTHANWPLITRACVIALCGAITTIAPGLGPRTAIAPELLLMLTAALGTLPVQRSVPAWLVPLFETLAAALVVAALPGRADLFLPYLLIPLATAGLAAGLTAALAAAAFASLALLLTTPFNDPSALAVLGFAGNGQPGAPPLTWILIFTAVAVVASWARRHFTPHSDVSEPAPAAEQPRPLPADDR